MRLLGDRILCKPIEVKQETPGGLILPTTMAEQNQFEVVMIGPKVKYLKVGDRVKKFINSKNVIFRCNNLEYLILRESYDIEYIY